MLPALLLDAQPEDLVLDLCACPGSKTRQILAGMRVKCCVVGIKGCVVANDCDVARCETMANQLRDSHLSSALIPPFLRKWCMESAQP